MKCIDCQSYRQISDHTGFCRQHELSIPNDDAQRTRICRRLCTGLYQTCPIAKTCRDRHECLPLSKAKLGGKPKTFEAEGFRYVFETVPLYDFRHAVRQKWKRRTKP